MDAPAAAPKIRFNRLLPYWAVLQTDLRQTLRSWVYRLWVIMAVLAAGGSVVYRLGVHQEAGIKQLASAHSGNMLRGLLIGSLGLVALLAVSAVGGERTTVADAVLSRGISRHQFYLAKWHSRLAVILGTFLALASGSLAAHHFFLDRDLSLNGGVVAVAEVTAILAVVVTVGVTIGALANGTVMGMTLFWLLSGVVVAVYGLQGGSPGPEKLLGKMMEFVLKGEYDPKVFTEVLMLAGGLCVAAASVGMIGFSRKDV